MTVNIKLTPGGRLPRYALPGDAGMDCYAREGGIIVRPEAAWGKVYISRVKVPLGFSISISDGYVGLINPRSGLGLKHAILAGTGARVIDSGYRGEVSALLFNLGAEDFEWKAGDRVAQLIISPVVRAELQAVDELEASVRGELGFGSSGR